MQYCYANFIATRYLQFAGERNVSNGRNMNPILQKSLDAICLERDGFEYSTAFDAAYELVKEYGEENLANRLFSEIPRAIPYEIVADLFNILIWQTSDNGSALCRETDDWLIETSDNRKILISLAMDAYPFLDFEKMKTVLTNLANSKPKFSEKCKKLILSREKLGC